MYSNYTKFLAAIAVAFALATPILAEDQAGTTGLVTVLDVAEVFEKNPAFSSKMEAIKAEADSLKTQIQAEQEKIRQDAMGLQTFEVGSPERNKLESELEQRQTKLRTTARQSEQDLLNREAVIYFETYQLMQTVVTQIAESNNISLVLRYDSSEIDKLNRPEVIKGVNRNIVFHRNLDLTKLVSATMNERTAAATAQNQNR